jgi:outer membrane protein OmpA-like peptidoglycan-associated protein
MDIFISHSRDSTMNQFFASRFFRKVFSGVALLAAALFAMPLYAAKTTQSAEPGKDHPLVGRYEGSVLTFYQKPTFDEIGLLKSPVNPKNYKNPDALQLEGNVSFYYYDWPEDRSALEVKRNFESSFKAKGLEILFSCSTSDSSCFTDKTQKRGGTFGMALGEATKWPKVLIRNVCGYSNSGDVQYILARHDTGEGVTHVSIAMCDSPSAHRAFVAVVESKAMDTDKIAFLDASTMQKSLDATGRVNLYGIYFDTDKDTIKPESKPTIDEITKLMRDNPQLSLQVVGHTDSTGGDAHNKDLSNRRAASVIRALTTAGIDGKRFTSRGAGATEPVTGNDTEAGRAKNRRVELVRQ